MQVGGEDLPVGADSTVVATVSQVHRRLLQGHALGYPSMNFVAADRCLLQLQGAADIAQLLLRLQHRDKVE
ncbi:hypothetical protein D3C75_1300440 [compost metagenome]